MITKVLGALHLKPNSSKNDDRVKVYVSNNGGLYVKGHELADNAAWRAKVKALIDADLTGRGKRESDD